MAKMAADPETQRWWDIMMPLFLAADGTGLTGAARTLREIQDQDRDK